MNYNEDYKKGMRIVFELGKKFHVNVRKYQWIPHISSLLSSVNACEKFWNNVEIQGRFKNIEKIKFYCQLFHNTNYDDSTSLFEWCVTIEGIRFWSEIDEKVFKVDPWQEYNHTSIYEI